MKLVQLLRTKYNHLLESAIRLTMLTAVTFVVTACYGTPPEGYYNDPEWRKDQDTLEHRMEQMGKKVGELKMKNEELKTDTIDCKQ